MVKKITNNQFAELYLGLAAHFDHLNNERYDLPTIYKHLVSSIQHKFNDPASTLYSYALPEKRPDNTYEAEEYDQKVAEQAKVWKMLSVVMESRKTKLPENKRQNISMNELFQQPIVLLVKYKQPKHSYCYHSNNDLLTWFAFHDMFHYSHCHPGCAGLSWLGGCGGGGGSKDGEALAMLLLVLLALIAVIIAAYCLYYVLHQLANSIERFVFNEGWMQAAITLSGMVAGGVAGAAVGTLLVATPIIMLALAAGVSNPAGWVILGIICLTIIGAAAGTAITNAIQDYAIKKANSDALDIENPYQVTLTESDVSKLVQKGYDPIEAIGALAELRSRMGPKKIPNVLDRILFHKSDYSEIQSHIEVVRKVRKGEMPQLELDRGQINFDFPAKPFHVWPVIKLPETKPEHDSLSASYSTVVQGKPVPQINHQGSHPQQPWHEKEHLTRIPDLYQNPYVTPVPSAPTIPPTK